MDELLQEKDNPSEQIVVFRLMDEYYGIPINRVREIVKKTPITIIPQTPKFVAGMMNLRGTIIPVVDLRLRFGFPEKEVDKETRIILVQIGEYLNGFIVDAVVEVAAMKGKTLQPTPEGVNMDERYIEGVFSDESKLIFQLNINEIIPNFR